MRQQWMWTASLLLGIATWLMVLGAFAVGDAELFIFSVCMTCFTSPAGFTFAVVSYVRKRGVKEVFTLLLNGIYLAAAVILVVGAAVLSRSSP